MQIEMMRSATHDQLVYATELKDKYADITHITTTNRRGKTVTAHVTVKPPVISATKEDAAAFSEDLAFGTFSQ